MKKHLLIITALVAFAFPAYSADETVMESQPESPACCLKAGKAGKSCEKTCCIAAAKEGKSCEKCLKKEKARKEKKTKKVD
jgi:hypothetical protein